MSIVPLPQFEADLKTAQEDREAYERLAPPTTIVVRFGAMRLIGEYKYKGDAKPGCGSKLVVRSHRGTEIGEMLTSTCPNAGCAKSVTRQEILEYIENSGGRDYPFFSEGRVLRVATIEDLNRQSQIESTKGDLVRRAKELVKELNLSMEVIDAEPILGGERLTFYFLAEQRVDFRELARRLSSEFGARIDLRQVGSRDEARLNADYERCGQHCCCRQFLKVLKPVSMRSAKTQKATLDPLKISGRCGRLMCCLRYEDETYETLRKRLPRRKTRVGTPEGPGIVVDAQILTQLVLVNLDADRRLVAVAVEDLSDPDAPTPVKTEDPLRGLSESETEERSDDANRKRRRGRRRGRGKGGAQRKSDQQDAYREKSQSTEKGGGDSNAETGKRPEGGGDAKRKRRRRRRRRKPGDGDSPKGSE